MLSREDNELLTKTGPGTPMGRLMRRYWIPALFSDQLPEPDGAPVRVKLLCEKLVAFRDTLGRVGLIDERCPHRTASLFFGRNEECGLRCVYHGWKFDIDGNCVDLPSEPWDKDFKRKIKITAYPCIERGGLVWAYMGPPELKPEFPDLEWTAVPATHRFVTRHVQECNWVQALEGGFDTSHLTFLHRGDDGNRDGVRQDLPQRYEVLPMDFGFASGTCRPRGETNFWTCSVMLMPFHKLISVDPPGAHAWVPIDDENTMNYCIDYRGDRALTDEDLADSRDAFFIHPQLIPGTDRPVANRDNNYLIDRALQKSGLSYTGIKGIGRQDCSIQELMGPVADRTIEHLGVSDSAIIKLRRLLLQTVKDHERSANTPLPGLDPHAYRVRPGRFTMPAAATFEEAVDTHVKTQRAGTGEVAMHVTRAALLLLGFLAASPIANAADHLRVGKAVQVGWTFTILEVGADQGIFAKYGIDPEIIAFAGEAKLMQAFAASAVDMGIGSGPGMVFNAKGSPTIAVAAYATDPRNIAVVVLPESPIQTVRDLKGKSLSVSSVGSLTEWLVKRLSVQEGWGPNGVTPVAVSSGAPQVAALRTHQVDGMMTSTEQGYQFEEEHSGRIIVTMDKYAPLFVAHVVEAQKSLVAEKPDVVNRFLKAYFATIVFIKTHKDVDVRVASKVLGSSLNVESRTYDSQIGMLIDDGHFDPAAVEVIKQSVVDMGLMPQKPGTDQLLTTQFLPVKP